jgi:hypothetical protein
MVTTNIEPYYCTNVRERESKPDGYKKPQHWLYAKMFTVTKCENMFSKHDALFIFQFVKKLQNRNKRSETDAPSTTYSKYFFLFQ